VASLKGFRQIRRSLACPLAITVEVKITATAGNRYTVKSYKPAELDFFTRAHESGGQHSWIPHAQFLALRLLS